MTATLVLPPYLTNCEQKIIGLSAGVVDYAVVDIVDSLKHDITADPVSIALMDATVAANAGPHPPAGIVWHPASFVTQNGPVYSVRAGLLLGSGLTYPVGYYWAWWKLVDSPTTTIAVATNRVVAIT
jgi:hypothetical protein